jgi:hypothetical protein
MTWCPDAPGFVVSPEGWGAAYASRYDPANGRPVITPASKLIVHHSASNQPHAGGEAAFSRELEAYGESRDGAACEYNFLLYPSGVLHGGFGDTRGCHASATDPATGSAYNSSAIGLCFVGYFHPPNNDQPTDEAIETFQAWLGWMIDSGRLTSDVLTKAPSSGQRGWYGHRDVWATACPGDVLYPILPTIIRPGQQPSPSPTPPGDTDVALVVANMRSDQSSWASFLANATWAPNWHGYVISSMIWITGPEKASYLSAGLPEMNLTFEQLHGIVLEGPLPQGDQAHPDWDGSEFKAWIRG